MGAVLHRINKAYSLRGREVTKTIHHTDLTAGAHTQTFDFTNALPEHALVIGSHVDVTEAFTDGAAGTFTCDVGIKGGDVDVWLDGVNIQAAIADLDAPKGVAPAGCFLGSKTPMVTIDGSVNLNTATAGNLVASLFYLDPTQAD